MNVSIIVKTKIQNNNNIEKDITIIDANSMFEINEKIKNCPNDYILSVNDLSEVNTDFIKRGIEVLNKNPEIGIVYNNKGINEITEKNLPHIIMFRKEDFTNAGKFKTYLSNGAENYDFWITLSEQGFESYKIN